MKKVETTLQMSAIALSTMTMIFHGGFWTLAGLLIASFWITIAVGDIRLRAKSAGKILFPASFAAA